MANATFSFFAGVDWATQSHQLCLLDQTGAVVHEQTIPHSPAAVAEFLDWLVKRTQCPPGSIAVSIEVPHGALVEALLERGLSVHSINPKQLDRFRDRYFPAGAKDDRRDAFVLANALRTDTHCFRRIVPDSASVVRLRDLSRLNDQLRDTLHRHCCQLREQLLRYYPHLLRLCPSANEPWMWDLLELAPTPAKAARLTPARIRKLLGAHRIRRLQADNIVAILREPGFPLTEGTVSSASEHALLLVPLLHLATRQRAELSKRIDAILDEMTAPANPLDPCQHRDAEIILSLPGVGRVVAATMLAEASKVLAQRDYHALRAYTGSAPVTRRSGKTTTVLMRRGCNERLRDALYHWSRVSVQCDEVSRRHYHQLRCRGHRHGRALRGVGDRLLAVLCAMLRDGTLYDPARRHTPVPAR